MKTKRIITVCLFLLAAWSGLCFARSDTQIYRNEECVYWADASTLEQISSSVYEIWVGIEYYDETIPKTIIIEHMDMNRRMYSIKRMFYREGSQEVELPLEGEGEWYSFQPDSMDEALYDFIYANLRRRGKL